MQWEYMVLRKKQCVENNTHGFMTHGVKTKARTLGVSKGDAEGFVLGDLGRGNSTSGSRESPLRCSSPKPSSVALTKCFALADRVSGQAAIYVSEEILLSQCTVRVANVC